MSDRQLTNETTDALDWAKTFMAIYDQRRDEIDEETMVGWFANAIETGREAGRQGMVEAISGQSA